jgi:hypothetical protein
MQAPDGDLTCSWNVDDPNRPNLAQPGLPALRERPVLLAWLALPELAVQQARLVPQGRTEGPEPREALVQQQ